MFVEKMMAYVAKFCILAFTSRQWPQLSEICPSLFNLILILIEQKYEEKS